MLGLTAAQTLALRQELCKIKVALNYGAVFMDGPTSKKKPSNFDQSSLPLNSHSGLICSVLFVSMVIRATSSWEAAKARELKAPPKI